MNKFLAGGGDGFPELANGTEPLVGSDDLDALSDYLTANSSAGAPLAAAGGGPDHGGAVIQ